MTATALWQARVALATSAARAALDRHGLADAAFTLRLLTPGRVVVEDLRLGKPAPVLAVDQVDVRFSWPELLRGHVARVAVSGVRTRLALDNGRLTSPLYERLKPLLAASARGDARPPKAGRAVFSLGAGTLQDVRVGVLLADGELLDTLTLEAGLLSEPPARGDARPPGAGADHGRGSAEPPVRADARHEGRGSAEPPVYRIWGSVRDDSLIQAQVNGTLDAATGSAALAPELKIKNGERLAALACRLFPLQAARLPAFPTNCTLSLRGTMAVQAWTNLGPFELTAELGRGSAWNVPAKDALVRFQSFRVEASGTPRDMQCRLSAGVAGFRVGGQLQASQEEGRMLSLRGTARFRQTATNQWLAATLDSELPGRSMALVLPRFLPLVPAFFSEGGTLRVEAEVARLPQAAWRGEARFKAEALRSSVPLAAGRVGAGTMRVSGTVAVEDAKPGVARMEIKLAEGHFYRRGLSVRGGVDATLMARPPYAAASGVFQGRVSESLALPQHHLALQDGAVLFEGEAEVTGLSSNPVWQVALRVPEFGVSSAPVGAAEARVSATSARPVGRDVPDRPASSGAEVSELAWQATAGARAALRYSATSLALEGDVWLKELALLAGPASNRTGEAGAGRIAARVTVPAFHPALASNALAGVTVSVSNGWALAAGMELDDLRASVPLTWSASQGLAFLPEPRLSWQRLEAQGLKVEPDALALSARGKTVDVGFGARVAGSRLGAALKASVPLDDPRQLVIDVTLPETEIAAEDAVAAWVRAKAKGTEFTGRVSAEAQVLFWGTHPRVTGRARLADGQVRSDKLSVEGLAADVPFQKGISFRTIDRPVVTFIRAKAGNVRLDQGRLTFQLTKREFFVDRMEVGWCKGSLNAYSVHLDLKNPKDDFVVYADRIDLGEALMMVVPFKGMMQGVLYGRFPVGFDQGHVKLSTGFLYSLPGQGGKLKLDDPAQMAALLEKAGIKGEVQVPLSRALSDMDFSTFKMDLEPGQGDEGTLRIKLGGRSNDKEWPAPVDVNLNFHGPLEELLNMGLKVGR